MLVLSRECGNQPSGPLFQETRRAGFMAHFISHSISRAPASKGVQSRLSSSLQCCHGIPARYSPHPEQTPAFGRAPLTQCRAVIRVFLQIGDRFLVVSFWFPRKAIQTGIPYFEKPPLSQRRHTAIDRSRFGTKALDWATGQGRSA